MSLQRISKNVSRCSDRLEEFWTSTGANDEILEEVVDYLELALYSAAEHVDDVNRIAMTFFESDVQAKNSKDFRLLKGRIRPLRSEISSFTNTIKHAHGRVRLYRVNFVHGNVASDLIGFFIEGFKDGSCGPSPILHTDGKKIISITSFLWNILTFLSEVSCVLYDFLLSVRAFDANDIERIEHEPFQDAAVKLSRLPNYSFDDKHPFERVRWVLEANVDLLDYSKSQIYGSMRNGWSLSSQGEFRGSKLLYVGDGITRSFQVVEPKSLHLQRWT